MSINNDSDPPDDLLDFVDQGLSEAGSGEFVDFAGAGETGDYDSAEGSTSSVDVLFLVTRLERQVPPSKMDLHSFSYLACLMSVFSGLPASQWGYSFSAVPPTLPYSPAIERAVADLLSAGLLTEAAVGDDGRVESTAPLAGASRYRSTVEGRDELTFLTTLSSVASRTAYLGASSATALVLSLPAVVNSLTLEPEVSHASRTATTRMLLRGPSNGALYDQFAALERVLGSDHEDLIVPACLYVRFLREQARKLVDQRLGGAE